jgi:hypothetical protein
MYSIQKDKNNTQKKEGYHSDKKTKISKIKKRQVIDKIAELYKAYLEMN